MGIKRFWLRSSQSQEPRPDVQVPAASGSLSPQKNNVVSIVAYKFQRMTEAHDRIRTRFLTEPRGTDISAS